MNQREKGAMKDNSSRHWIIPAFIGLGVFFAATCLPANQARATSDNRQHELGVYSLCYFERDWKPSLWPFREEYELDPAGAFWDLMTSGNSREYAHHASRRRIDSEVNYRTVFPIPGDGWKDWDSFDLVFFFGHNNMITPPHPPWDEDETEFWSNNSGIWGHVCGRYSEWGTEILPFEYYIMDVVDGPTHPSSVTYLYEAYTSALIGHHQFNPDYDWPIQLSAQDTPDGNSPGTIDWCRGGLGTNDLEWLILHGCQGVIVADADGEVYNPLGVEAFRHAWDGFHLILGHYKSYAWSRDLSPFADALRTGVTVQAAYFLVDPDNNTSAISAERLAFLLTDPDLFNFALRNGSMMNTDTWTDPAPDLGRRADIWYVKWIRQAGTDASFWAERLE